MSTCKITYNGNEISAVDETAPVSVAYNSATIAILNDVDTKTLGCNGKVMASDVVVGGKTLNCNGKLMQGDIVVELVGSATSGETWYFNDRISITKTSRLFTNFTSNGVAYIGFYKRNISFNKKKTLQYSTSEDDYLVYSSTNNNLWLNEAYRTIVLDKPATGDVLAFLEANATKLS